MKKAGLILFCITMLIICLYNVREYKELPKADGERHQYRVDMQLYPENHCFDANVIINVKNTSNDTWNEVVLRDYPSQFRSEKDGGMSQISSIYNEENGTSLEYQRDEDPTVIRIKLDEPLESGKSTTVSFFYQAFLPDKAARFGYVEKTPGQLDFYLGNSLPILCVYENGEWVVEPYFDVGECFYSDISDYQVRVTTPLDYTIIGTGKMMEIDLAKETRSMTFKAKAVRDFCLIIGNDYKLMNIIKGGIEYSSYYHSKNSEAGAKAMEDLLETMDEFSQILGAYPYPSINTVGTYTEMQGMEYPQIVMISSEMTGVKTTLRHELAHQWFYGIVGNNSYQEAWLDESIATYLAEDVIEGYQNILDKSYGDFENDGDYVHSMYFSGGSMYTELSNKFGKKRFHDFLYNYLKKYAYQNVKTEHLLEMIVDEFGAGSMPILKEYFTQDTIDSITS